MLHTETRQTASRKQISKRLENISISRLQQTHVVKPEELVIKKNTNADKRASKGDTKAIGTEESKGLPRQEAMASEALDVGPGLVDDGKAGPPRHTACAGHSAQRDSCLQDLCSSETNPPTHTHRQAHSFHMCFIFQEKTMRALRL